MKKWTFTISFVSVFILICLLPQTAAAQGKIKVRKKEDTRSIPSSDCEPYKLPGATGSPMKRWGVGFTARAARKASFNTIGVGVYYILAPEGQNFSEIRLTANYGRDAGKKFIGGGEAGYYFLKIRRRPGSNCLRMNHYGFYISSAYNRPLLGTGQPVMDITPGILARIGAPGFMVSVGYRVGLMQSDDIKKINPVVFSMYWSLPMGRKRK